jgi:hypothetical protein
VTETAVRIVCEPCVGVLCVDGGEVDVMEERSSSSAMCVSTVGWGREVGVGGERLARMFPFRAISDLTGEAMMVSIMES